MAVKLSFDERKWLLKSYWKVENVVEVQRHWRVEFGTPPKTRVIITRIRDKFEVDGTVQDVLKGRCGRKRSSSDNESADAVMKLFATEFPPRSPDLTPLDFYLWGTLKNTVYATEPQTLEELREKIEHTINDIPLATIQTVCALFDVVVGSILWQKVDILNMYGFNEV